METLGSNPVVGTKFKVNINMDPIESYHLADVDWNVLVFTDKGCKRFTIDKAEAIKVDDDNYIVMIDSSICGAGQYYITLTAYIPDADFDDGLRPEKRTAFTGETIDPR